VPDTSVVVVGAGVHGAAAARGLAERGAAVTVLERGTPAGGPTGRSSAICRAYYTNPFLAACARDSIVEMAAGPLARLAGFRRTGGVYLHPARDRDAVTAAADRLTGLGVPVRLLDPAEADRAAGGGLDLRDVALAAAEPGAGCADPHGVTTALLAAAAERGAVVRPRSTVVGFDTVAGGVAVRLADGSDVLADRVLLAAGPWTRPLAALAGADLPLTVERHVVAIVDARAAARVPVVLLDVPGSCYVRPEGRSLLLAGWIDLGEPADPDTAAERVTDEEALALAAALVRRVPRLGTAAPAGGWASVYDVSPDWQPVVGAVAPGVYVDAGTSGHGFKLAPAWGRRVAGLLVDDPDPGLAQFSPARFAAGRPLAAGYGRARILG
jgi:sarcosine oxidase subunit beta